VNHVSPYAPTEVLRHPGAPAPVVPAAPPAKPAQPESPRLYFPAVDGLRGVAILSVLLYHTSWFENGLFGVDVFMVLSGFLITLLLFREVDRTGKVALGSFYRRRFKRLMPGLSITLVVVLVLAFLLGGLRLAEQVGDKAVASLFQVANWQQIRNDDAYWEGFGQINPLAHMWSLSITEQFYLVWPVLFLIFCWICRRSVVAMTVIMTLALAGTAALAPLLYDGTNADRLYLGTEIRTVDFVAGGVAAGVVFLIHRAAARREREGGPGGTALATFLGVVTLGALVAISLLTSNYRAAWLYEGGIAAVAVITAILIASLSRSDGPLIKIFSFGPLTEIGRISYTMYLLHLPIFWLMQEWMPTIKPYALFIVGGGLTWLGSMLMHYGITERIRLRPWPPVRATSVAVLTTAAVVAGGLYLPDLVERRMNPGDRPVLLVLGDSLSTDFAEALALDGRDKFAVVDGSIEGCGVMPAAAMRPRSGVEWPMGEKCKIRTQLWEESLHAAEYTAVVAHFGWDAADQLVDGRWINPCDPDYRTRYLAALTEATTMVRKELPNVPFLLMNERTGTEGAPDQSVRCYNKIIDDFVKGDAAHLVDFKSLICREDGQCHKTNPAGEELFADGVHFTDAGRNFIAPGLESAIAETLAAAAAKPAPAPKATKKPAKKPSSKKPSSGPQK
jgi:peptidoglycan/LPS O-acetylase OafA/YrhL